MITVTKRTLVRRQGAQDLALVLLSPWVGLIYAAVFCGWSPQEENGRSEPAARRPPLSTGSVMERGPEMLGHAPQVLDKGVVFAPVV